MVLRLENGWFRNQKVKNPKGRGENAQSKRIQNERTSKKNGPQGIKMDGPGKYMVKYWIRVQEGPVHVWLD